MNRHFKKLISASMACVMVFCGTSVIASAAETKPMDSNFSSSEIKISDSTTDLYITDGSTKQVDIVRSVKENDGTYSYYGWYNVGNKKDFTNMESNFEVSASNGKIVYTAKGKTAKVVANPNNANREKLNNDVTFPTKWVPDVSYGSVDTDTQDKLELAAFLAEVVGCRVTGGIMAVAANILSHHINDTYYKKTTYSRDLDSCTLQQYDEVIWYKNSNYTGSLGTSKSDITETYLC